MCAVLANDMADLTLGTLNDLGPPKFSQIAQKLQRYEVMSKWLKKDKVVFEDGRGIQRNLMTTLGEGGGYGGVYDEDRVTIGDHMAQMEVPWRHVNASWGWERRTDKSMNRGKSLVFDTIIPRRVAAMLRLAGDLETGGWSAPSLEEVLEPFGLPYWIVKDTSTTGGFNGGLPSDHVTVGNVNITTHPGFMNYAGAYTDVTFDDLIQSMLLGHMYVDFQSPVTAPEYRGALGKRFRVYVNFATKLAFDKKARMQNDDLGPDVAKMDGQSTFKNHPIIPVPQLNADSSNPVYMVDHDTFFPVVLSGEYMTETVKPAPSQRTVTHVFIDLTFNFICIDRRRNAVWSVAA